MKYYLLFLMIGMAFTQAISQTQNITVVENTLKIRGLNEEILYYGFYEGDKIVFSFQEQDGKEMKEIEILEYPGTSRYMEYKSSRVDNKIITVGRTGIYAFRMTNTALTGRICKIKIDRIPANDQTKDLNTAVKWIDRTDTTWNVYTKDVVVGYDTLLIHKTEKVVVRRDTSEGLFLEKSEQVHSRLNPNGNKSYVFFSMPSYSYTNLHVKRPIAMAYWIGVGNEGKQQWEQNKKIGMGLVKTVAGAFVSPLGAYAIGAIVDLAITGNGDKVYYALVDETNKNLFMYDTGYSYYDQGNGNTGKAKFTEPSYLSGSWFIILKNESVAKGIYVDIKISVMVETIDYEMRPYTEQKITARHEKKIMREPIVKVQKVPMIVAN